VNGASGETLFLGVWFLGVRFLGVWFFGDQEMSPRNIGEFSEENFSKMGRNITT
jgi:hypothetical protein